MPPRHGPGIWQRLRAEVAWLDDFVKRWLARLLVFSIHLFLVVAACYGVMWAMARSRAFASVDEVPVRYAGLVLGCVRKLGPDDNVFFNHRVDAAVALYEKGRVQYLLVSGDSHRDGCNEPLEMKNALVARGVPADKIYCDDAGFSTLDSVVRAGTIFGQKDCTIVSQRFHNERALYLALRSGMSGCVALDAADASPEWMIRMYAREVLARVMAVLDVEVFKTQPKVLGQRILIGPATPPVEAPAG